jgi:IS5 family transposase
MGSRINWEDFRLKLEAMFKNNTDRGGRPNLDVIVMFKSLFIQQLYNLSDEQLERELADRISFRVFLGTTEVVPDSTTIWKFRERLAETGADKEVWIELQRQLDAMNLKVQKGIMQDATFITSDPGHAKADTPRGDEAKTRRSRDGAWAKKGTKSFFGYKLHQAMDDEFGMVRRIEVTAANVHDSQVDLAKEGEVRYADKGYFGAKTKGYDASMKKATRGHILSYKDEMRNKRISSKRSPVERFFAFIKRVSEKYITFTNLTRCLSIISFAFEIYVMQRSIYIL